MRIKLGPLVNEGLFFFMLTVIKTVVLKEQVSKERAKMSSFHISKIAMVLK